MKPAARILLASLCTTAVQAAGGLHLINVEAQTRIEPSAALVSGQEATLAILTPPEIETGALAPVFKHLTGTGNLAAPIAVEATFLPTTQDTRVARLRVRPPEVVRVTRLALWLGSFGPITLTIFPSASPRADLVPLNETLAASGLHLAVCGGTDELRAHLRSEKIEFDDLGSAAPDRVPDDTLLIGWLRAEDLERLAAEPGGPLIIFMDEPALLPGVYARHEPKPRRTVIKVTLPLAPLLSSDPRARDTLHRLILQTLPVAPR